MDTDALNLTDDPTTTSFLLIGLNAMDNLGKHGYLEKESTPIRSRTPDERREYDRTQRRVWVERRKIAGRKVG